VSPIESDDDAIEAIEHRCATAVDRLMKRYCWQLLERSEFVRRAAAHMRSGRATTPDRAAVGVYSLALYTACSGHEGRLRQELGYSELHRSLYNVAAQRAPALCDDLTQSAIERVYTNFANCREPIAFLAFAFQQLAAVLRDAERAERRATIQSLDSTFSTDELPPNAWLANGEPGPPERVLDAEQQAELHRIAHTFVEAHPRAVQQLAALWLKYIEELDDMVIADRLGVSVNSVYVLRSRAVKKLRNDPRWRELAAVFGVLDDEVQDSSGPVP
jgi:RNA polymerase sigma factor (sigma-70 family)